GGQKQRVAIAGVLAISPKVIILDEATAMLDPRGRQEIMKTVSSLQQENQLGLITITHDLEEVVQAERVIVMNEGKIWKEASPRDIFSQKEDLQSIGLDLPFINIMKNEIKILGM